jgi:hypothetical protein
LAELPIAPAGAATSVARRVSRSGPGPRAESRGLLPEWPGRQWYYPRVSRTSPNRLATVRGCHRWNSAGPEQSGQARLYPS